MTEKVKHAVCLLALAACLLGVNLVDDNTTRFVAADQAFLQLQGR